MQKVIPHSRQDWRDWLLKNHEKESAVYVVKHKKHVGKYWMTYHDLMHEAICFGWIDTTVKKRDKDTYQICFRKRTDNARWSRNTLRYAKMLIEQGLMMPAGLKRYQEGLTKKTIDHVYPSRTHPELLKALKQNPVALKHFKSLSPSSFKIFNWWVYSAKTPETREKRIKATVQKCVEGKKNYMQK